MTGIIVSLMFVIIVLLIIAWISDYELKESRKTIEEYRNELIGCLEENKRISLRVKEIAKNVNNDLKLAFILQ